MCTCIWYWFSNLFYHYSTTWCQQYIKGFIYKPGYSWGLYPKVSIIGFDKYYPPSLEQASWSVFLVWSYMVGSGMLLLLHPHFSCIFSLPFNLFPYIYDTGQISSWHLGPLWMNKEWINGQLVEILHVVTWRIKLLSIQFS